MISIRDLVRLVTSVCDVWSMIGEPDVRESLVRGLALSHAGDVIYRRTPLWPMAARELPTLVVRSEAV